MSEPELHEKEKKPPPPLLHRKNSNGSSLKPAADEKPAVTAICQLPLLGLPKVAIVVGDPARALKVAERAKELNGIDFTCVAMNREYHSYVFVHKGKRLLVGSHGIGGGGASCYFEELIQAGVTTIIRAGTCGSYDPQLREGSLIIATGAVRSDGVGERLIPLEYPAIADFRVVQTMVDVVRERKDVPSFGVGLINTIGHFYDGPLGNKNRLWEAARVLGVEMEASILMLIGSLRGVKTGCICNVDNYIFERELAGGKYEPNRSVVIEGTKRMVEIALDTAARLSDS